MPKTPNLPLAAWMPDADPTAAGVMVDVSNLLPTQRGYAPDYALEDAAASIATLATRVCGASTLHFASQTPCLFVGTETKLFRVFGGLTDVSRTSGGAYAADFDPYYSWRFAAFGDVALAVNRIDTLQATALPYSTPFANVSGAPPASTICTQSNFVMLGNMNGGAWPYNDGWWCSALADHTSWTPDVATQAARGRLTQIGGPIVRMVAFGPHIWAFKEQGIIRGTYVGPPNIWSWQVISADIGLVGHWAVVEAEGVLYWLGRNGIYRSAGGAPQRIQSAPWATLTQYLYPSTGLSCAWRTHAQWDPARRVIRWYVASEADLFDHGFAYHPDTDRWGRFDTDTEWGSVNAYFDYSGTPGVSNGFWWGAALVVDSDHAIKTYRVTPADSSFVTGDVGSDDEVATVTRLRVRYVDAPTTASMTHQHRMNLGDALTTGATASRVDGKFDVSHSARWHRFTVEQTGMCEALGFSLAAEQAGTR